MKWRRVTISVSLATLVVLSLFCGISSTAGLSAQEKLQTNIPVGASGGSTVAACSADLFGGNLDLFAKGSDGALWWEHGNTATGWSGWQSLGGHLTSDPAVTSSYSGHVEIVVSVRGTDGALWSKSSSDGGNSWSGWYGLGGQLLAGTGPAVYCWIDWSVNPAVVHYGWFATGTNHVLYWRDLSHGWQSFGGYLTSSPAATTQSDSVFPPHYYMDVFGRGSDGALWYKASYNGP